MAIREFCPSCQLTGKHAVNCPLRPPPTDIVTDCEIGFALDLENKRAFMEFNQHVRCIAFDRDALRELIVKLQRVNRQLGEYVEVPDDQVTH
jgi:hypothetical protein